MGRHFLALSQACFLCCLPLARIDVSILRMGDRAVSATTLSCALSSCVALLALARLPGLLFLTHSTEVLLYRISSQEHGTVYISRCNHSPCDAFFAFAQCSAVRWWPRTS